LYVKSISNRDKTKDYENKLFINVDVNGELKDIVQYFKNISSHLASKQFTFSDEVLNKILQLHKHLLIQGYQHSNKGKNFTNIIDFTLLDVLTKMSCINSAFYFRNEIAVQDVELAFMDLTEFFAFGLDFVKDKIMGKVDYGESWNGAKGQDQSCLAWLYETGALSEDSSNITIAAFKEQISLIKGITIDAAEKHYSRFKKNGWIDSKQIGQHDSKSWLAFKPNLVQGSEGSKGSNPYNIIISNLIDKKTYSLGLQPLQPLQPSDVDEEQIEDTPTHHKCSLCGAEQSDGWRKDNSKPACKDCLSDQEVQKQ
jgi:hypothetical protein